MKPSSSSSNFPASPSRPHFFPPSPSFLVLSNSIRHLSRHLVILFYFNQSSPLSLSHIHTLSLTDTDTDPDPDTYAGSDTTTLSFPSFLAHNYSLCITTIASSSSTSFFFSLSLLLVRPLVQLMPLLMVVAQLFLLLTTKYLANPHGGLYLSERGALGGTRV